MPKRGSKKKKQAEAKPNKQKKQLPKKVDEDDEEIDEDMAFDAKDEEKYGHLFIGKGGDENGEGEGDDDEADGEDGAPKSLSDMLDDEPTSSSSSSSSSSPSSSISKQKQKVAVATKPLLSTKMSSSSSLSSQQKRTDNKEEDDINEDGDDDDVEDEDEGEEEEVEVGEEEEEGDEGEEDGDEGEGESADAHANLLKTLGALDQNTASLKKKATATKKKTPKQAKGTELLEETEFASASGEKGEEGEGGGGLNLQDLMGSLANLKNADLKKLKNRLIKLRTEKKTQPLDLPLEEIHQQNVERKITYENVKKEIGHWVPVVTKNRLSKSLSFPLNEQQQENVSSASLQTHFTATNNLEKDLETILTTYGYTEKALLKKEQKQMLEERELSEKEIQEKQHHLSQLKSLLFYHEIKQKRLKKIKSKQYRKLKKKREEGKKLSSEELARLNPAAAHDMQITQEAERIKERMTQRHKNSSKWAKKTLEQMKLQRMGGGGGGNLKDARTALEQQLATHQKLSRKPEQQLGRGAGEEEELGSSDDDDDDEDDEDEEEGGGGSEKRYKAKINALKQQSGDEPDVTKVKGVAGLKFMQKGFERRKQETEKLLAEALADEKNGQEGEQATTVIPEAKSRKKFTALASLSATSPSLPEDGRIEMLSNGFQSSKVGFSKGFTIGTDRPVDTAAKSKNNNMNSDNNNVNSSSSNDNLFEVEEFSDPETEQKKIIQFKPPAISAPPSSSSSSALPLPKSILKRKAPEAVKVLDSEENDSVEKNPWQADGRTAKAQVVKLDTKNLQLLPSAGANNKASSSVSSKFNLLDDTNADVSKIGGQERLVKEAFSITGEAEQMFRKEKEELVSADLPKFEDHAVPGWGNWGDSKSKPKPMSKMKLKIKAAIEKKAAEEAAGRQDAKLAHVIISQKTDKKSLKYMVPQLPYPYTSIEQFDKAQRTPIGTEWNTQNTFQDTIKPAVITKPGVIIDPISRSNKSIKRKQASKAGA